MDRAQLVIIEWVDSRQPTQAWTRLLGFKPEGICQCVSVGFLVYDGEDYKVLAANMADVSSETDMQASGVINIPSACITRITPLEEVATTSCGDPAPVSEQTQPHS
jgi:hypothetical protein